MTKIRHCATDNRLRQLFYRLGRDQAKIDAIPVYGDIIQKDDLNSFLGPLYQFYDVEKAWIRYQMLPAKKQIELRGCSNRTEIQAERNYFSRCMETVKAKFDSVENFEDNIIKLEDPYLKIQLQEFELVDFVTQVANLQKEAVYCVEHKVTNLLTDQNEQVCRNELHEFIMTDKSRIQNCELSTLVNGLTPLKPLLRI